MTQPETNTDLRRAAFVFLAGLGICAGRLAVLAEALR